MREFLRKLEAAFAAAAFAEEGEAETAREIAAEGSAPEGDPGAAPRPIPAHETVRPLRPVPQRRARKVSRLP